MSPERHEHIKKLFLAACELQESERPAFLDKICKDDPELRSELESLLKHHTPDTIIASPPEGATVRMPAIAAEILAAVNTSPDSAEAPPRFIAGTMIADRYRIVELLGRGGMGEVYRADDLKLRCPDALKFLLHAQSGDDIWLARFYGETNLARKVTHRYVCRVHDIAEANGEAFISMDYVDGEDLSSLLKRVGRLPSEKAVQIARQICCGLGAAHSAGVLHRDLKPGNIMIDGEGEVRITDFGIAVAAGPTGAGGPVAGTLAYMAPEVLMAGWSTISSDIYSLGLILYELVTGQRAFKVDTLTEYQQRTPPPHPSSLVENLDPSMEQVILRCIDNDPRNRPASAYEVLAALPGGDRLAMAMAAGEILSPEVVADAKTNEESSPRRVIACLALAAVGLIAVILLANRTLLLSSASLDKSPDVLEDRSRDVIRELTGSADTRDIAAGFVIDHRGLAFMRDRPRGLGTQETSAISRHSALFFEYLTRMQGDRPISFLEEPRQFDLSFPTVAGTLVRLNPSGALRTFRIVSDLLPSDRSIPRNEPDWSIPFKMAGLDLASFTPTPSSRPPPLYAEHCLTWESKQKNTSVPLRVEGASVDGRVVWFNVVPPWEYPVPDGTLPADRSGLQSPARIVLIVLFFVTLPGGVPLAWLNLRRGLGDRRGAGRLALFTFVLELLLWVVRHRPVADFGVEINALLSGLRVAAFASVAVWIYYLAMEPYVRRFWPHSMIAWSRMLAGKICDPRVGRDILIGTVFGIGIVLIQQINGLVPPWPARLSSAPMIPAMTDELGRLMGFRHTLDALAHAILLGIGRGLLLVMLMLLIRLLVRIPWLAALIFFGIVTTAYVLSVGGMGVFTWVTCAITAGGTAVLLVRSGVLAVVVSLFVTRMIMNNPMTFDFHAWFAGTGGFALAVLAGLLAFGAYASAGDRASPRRPVLAD